MSHHTKWQSCCIQNICNSTNKHESVHVNYKSLLSNFNPQNVTESTCVANLTRILISFTQNVKWNILCTSKEMNVDFLFSFPIKFKGIYNKCYRGYNILNISYWAPTLAKNKKQQSFPWLTIVCEFRKTFVGPSGRYRVNNHSSDTIIMCTRKVSTYFLTAIVQVILQK